MMWRLAGHGVAITLLTLLTQLGGIAWLICALIARTARMRGVLVVAIFLAIYGTLSVGARYAAPVFGRTALPCTDAGAAQIAVLHPLYCALNRNYVTVGMRDYADSLAAYMHQQFPQTRTRALDANFPFIDGFPLLPHLSHDDGQKLDLAFYYLDANGAYQPGKARWFLGYWGYEQPRPGDPQPCAVSTGLNLRWDMAWLQPVLHRYRMDTDRTGAALRWLGRNPTGTGFKVLIEPHLATRLGVGGNAIRFQGCRAARHDDHIHIQFQP